MNSVHVKIKSACRKCLLLVASCQIFECPSIVKEKDHNNYYCEPGYNVIVLAVLQALLIVCELNGRGLVALAHEIRHNIILLSFLSDIIKFASTKILNVCHSKYMLC